MRRCDFQPSRISQNAGWARGPCFFPHVVWLAVVFTGCRGSSFSTPTTYEVKGKVVLPNGKPLSTGRVTFVAADGLLPQASGDIQLDGAFSLSTRVPGDGAAPGTYKVRIEPAEGKNRRAIRLGFPVKYVDEDSSGLVITVRSESNQLDPIRLNNEQIPKGFQPGRGREATLPIRETRRDRARAGGENRRPATTE
jgi:hypothetical protein